MQNKKKHLQKEERFLIEKMLRINKSITYIAKLLERGISTVSEEVSRNGGQRSYDSKRAQFKALERQANKKIHSNKVIANRRLRRQVEALLGQGLSPESASLKLRNTKGRSIVSGKSIRKFLINIRRQ